MKWSHKQVTSPSLNFMLRWRVKIGSSWSRGWAVVQLAQAGRSVSQHPFERLHLFILVQPCARLINSDHLSPRAERQRNRPQYRAVVHSPRRYSRALRFNCKDIAALFRGQCSQLSGIFIEQAGDPLRPKHARKSVTGGFGRGTETPCGERLRRRDNLRSPPCFDLRAFSISDTMSHRNAYLRSSCPVLCVTTFG
jgi:hypothetical protein